jgi:hypothetical protein
MDQKGFDRLQTAVQFAVDEDRRSQQHRKLSSYTWRQGLWGLGWLTSETVRGLVGGRKSNARYQVVCPTAGCIAGTIVTQHGDKMVVASTTASQAVTVGEKELVLADYCVDDQDVLWGIEQRASNLLGLDLDETALLFGGGQEIDGVVLAATQIALEHGYRLEVIR